MVVRQQGITVVGGGRGALGSAVVSRLAAAGRRVVIPTRHPGGAAAPPGVTEIECDLDDAGSVERLRAGVEAMGAWTAVVSASGGYAGGRAHEVDDAAIEAQLSANLLGPWRLVRAAAASMVARRRGWADRGGGIASRGRRRSRPGCVPGEQGGGAAARPGHGIRAAGARHNRQRRSARHDGHTRKPRVRCRTRTAPPG